MKCYSLTRRLVTTVLLIELASALCVSGLALIYERHMHFRSFDILLRGRADSLLGAVQDAEDANDNVMLDGTELSLPAEDIYQVRDASGRLLGQSTNWPGVQNLEADGKTKMKSHQSEPASEQEPTFLKASVDHREYRVIRISGLRIVDPGDKGGGIRRYVTIYYGSSVDRVWRVIFRAVAFYAGSSLAVLAITGILMSWLLSGALGSLRGLAAAASTVSVASWSFAPPESARRTKELEPLVHALETVLAGLETSFEKQRRFVGDAAHELKTGVAVVKSSLQLLSMKRRNPSEYEAGLERCLEDCLRMEGLVAQMLTLARVEEAVTSPSDASVTEAYEAVRDVVTQLEPMAESKRISIVFNGAESLAQESTAICVDMPQFKLLATNLLMNALQHSPIDSTIRIEIRSLEGFAQLEIRDQGDGIDPAELPTLFDRFSRSDPSRSRYTGGTGLGLAICKAITDRFHGTIEILSELHVGTVVVVRLPLMQS